MRTARIVVLALLAISLGLAQTITSTSPLPGGTLNVSYSVTLTCTNCTSAVWAAAGNIPPGLGINSASGTISGTPSSVGTFNFTVTLTLPGVPPTSKPFAITITAPPLNIQNTSFPNGSVNTVYPTQKLVASGGVTPYVWSATGLPPGLSVSGVTIGGTPTTAGFFTFMLTVTDSVGTAATMSFSITISGGTLTISNNGFPNGTVGVAYPTQTLSASGGVPPYSWSVSAGLPPGLGLSQNTIVGTPTTAGTYSFILTVFDNQENSARMQLSITIVSGGPSASINTTSLPSGILNQPYTAQLICSNCTGYTWSVSSGTLPLGLTLSQGGTISGTPTTAGVSNFQVSLTPPSITNVSGSITQILSITINQGGLTIVQTSLPIATQGSPYSTTLTGMGGSTPYTWSFSSTSNDGLSIAASTGVISGTPASPGQFFLSVTITDSFGLTATKAFTLTVAAPLTVLTTSLPNGSLNTPYPIQTLSAGGGQPPYRWIVVTTGPGNLPPGLTLDGVFGRISGTPTASGTFPFQLMVTDNNSLTATGSLSITIGSGASITIAPATLPGATVGTAYSQTLTASGGQAPYTFAITTGSLPVGLILNATTGVINGTPTLPGSASFTVQATDSTKATGQAALSIAVTGNVGPLTITTTSLPDGTVGTAYSQAVAATGGTTPYSFSITAGALPAGLTLDPASGTISGTPTAVATSSFTVTVTDAAKTTASQALTITTAVALTVTPTTLPAAVVGTAYTQKFTAVGGKAPYTFALTGTLPAGFTFAAATATITGTAPSAESGSFTITVTDASSRTVTLSLTLAASAAPLSITPTTLPNATVGVAYTQVLTAAGGIAPYTFALTGNLPSGLTFNATTHTISGTPAAIMTPTQNFNFTITVTDSSSATFSAALSLTVSNPTAPTVTLTVTGPSSSGFAQQIPYSIGVGTTYPLAISGTVTLSFAPSVTPSTGVDDQMIQFASGGTCTTVVPHTCTLNFTIPANSMTPAPSTFTVLTGTTAGTITLTTSMTAGGVTLTAPTPTKIVNNSGVPFISNVSFQQTPGGVTVTVVGFSSTRDMVSGLFHFAPASNVTLTSSDITVQLATAYTTWWSNTAQSNPFGTQFTLTMPFTISTQTTAIVSVTVTLTNSKGASNAVTLSQ